MDLGQNSDIACGDLKERLVLLEKLLADPLSDCYIERLLDVVIAAVNDSRSFKTKENDHVTSFLKRFASVAATLRSYRRQPQDFSLIASLGHGAFGRVQLVREITTGRVCAMKVLKKSRMLTQHTDYWAEREIMARGESPWIVQLFYAFQDVTSLYMVMEYVPGGTLVGWMEDVEVISEAACRFYAAETVLALSDLHAMGFIHRDLKPDNLLLDSGGHLKLADFGTAIRVEPDTLLIHCDAAVGTPDYLSPEVLLSQGAGGGSYGFEVDWWALGVLVYEMLYGDTPFYSETLVNTYAKIMSHTVSLKFPDSVRVSGSAMDFMKQLLRSRDCRLGSGPNGSVAVRGHAWFAPEWAESAREVCESFGEADVSLADWTWSNIRACRAPFQPNLTSETDTAYFPLDTDDESQQQQQQQHRRSHDIIQQRPGPQARTDPLGEIPGELSDRRSHSPETEAFLNKYPGTQLAFAGFSFSSSHPTHLALLNGLYLAPRSAGALSISAELMKSDNEGPEDVSPNHTCLAATQTNLSDPHSDKSASATVLAADAPDRPATTDDLSLNLQLSEVHSQGGDISALTELHANELAKLTDQLEQVSLEKRTLESELTQRELAYRNALEQVEQRLELVRSEATADLARLEAEIAKWKSVAQSEQAARQSAEAAGSIAVATATARLAKQAAEVADRVAGAGSRNSLSHVMPPTSPTNQDTQVINQSNDVFSAGLNCPPESGHVDGNGQSTNHPLTSIDSQALATNLLLSRIEEMARRAHRAEAAAREATDALEAEQRFSRLYRDTCAENSDQLKEVCRERDELRELLATSEKACRRSHEDYEAARRALTEEQQRSARYREATRLAEEDALAASHRATLARREVAHLHDQLEQMTQAYAKEKLNFAATVNKLTQVMSGENADALELMLLAQQNEDSARSGLFSGSTKLAALRSMGQQQRLQSQLRQRDRENKRLLNEINRLNTELATAKRSQAHAQMLESRLRAAESKITQLTDEGYLASAHIRQNGDTVVPVCTQRPGSVQMRNRSEMFGTNRSKMGFLHSIENASAIGQKPFPSPSTHMVSSVSSSPELPASRDSLVRHNSCGETYVHAVYGSGGTSSILTDLFPNPMHVLKNPSDFTIHGVLELGVKHRGKKKLCWEPRIARLTAGHLILSQYVSDSSPQAVTGLSSGTGSLSLVTPTLSRQSRVQAVATIFELPLTAICHVRSINSCDLYHQPTEDVPRIFQLIYDRPSSSDTALNGASSNSGHSMTLPRKLSFGSSGMFSVQSPHPFPPRRVVRTDSVSSSSATSSHRSGFTSPANNSSGGQTDTPGTNNTNISIHSGAVHPRSPVPPSTPPIISPTLTGQNWLLPLQGHTFQRITMRVSASCDICRQPCWHLISPPPVLQCTHCQLKLHASHVERQECTLQACEKAMVVYFFRCESESEKQQWVCRLLAAIKHAKGSSSTQSIAFQSTNADLPSDVRMRANSTKTLPAVSASTGRRITPSPDRVTVCSPRSSRIINNSSKVLTADTVILMDTKDDPNGTEMHLNLESSDVPSSTTTHSNNFVVAHADQAPPSNSVPTCELGELVGEKWTPKETARR